MRSYKTPYPAAHERAFERLARERATSLATSLIGALLSTPEARRDALADTFDALAIVRTVGEAHETRYALDVHTRVRAIGSRLVEYQDRGLARFVGDVVGIDARRVLTRVRAQPLDELVGQWSASALQYVANAEAAYLDRARELMTSALVEGRSTRTLARELADAGVASGKRARFIARDQIASLNASATEARHEQLGVTQYIWRTSGDERVRASHAERNGRTFDYADPPSDGHPGKPVACRCTADPILPLASRLFA